jgi:hypothetical protein
MKDREQLISFIELELEANIHVLIDPKRKDSFSAERIYTWKKLVSERICIHLNKENDYEIPTPHKNEQI